MTGNFTVITIEEHTSIEGKDRIVSTFSNGLVCVINKEENPIGCRGILFDCESEINSRLLHELSLYRDKTLNKDENKTGFFRCNRVKPQKFAGVKCSGFFLSFKQLKSIDWLDGINELSDNYQSNSHNKEEICIKWIPPRSSSNNAAGGSGQKKKKKKSRVLDGQFSFHKSTGHFGNILGAIKPDTHITISHKLHGTSFVSSRILCRKKIGWFGRLVTLGLYNPVVYDNVFSSRNVIKNDGSKGSKNHWYKTNIWGQVNDLIKDRLEDGISVYGEITGFVDTGSYIQKGYDYGSKSPEYKYWIYRITHTDKSGKVKEFLTDEILTYCDRMQLNTVPYIFTGLAEDFLPPSGEIGYYGRNMFQKLTEDYLERDCPFCVNKVPAEGVIVRIENPDNFSAWKLKSFDFKMRESGAKSADIETEN